jgi:hypothetical protein
VPCHRNVNYLQDEVVKGCYDVSIVESEAYITNKPAREQKCDNNTIPLGTRTSHRSTMIPQNPPPKEGTKQLSSSGRMSESFAWHASDPTEVTGRTLGHRPRPVERERKTKLALPGTHRSPNVATLLKVQ